MNIWLHKQVMDKLAEGGGKVPQSLKHWPGASHEDRRRKRGADRSSI